MDEFGQVIAEALKQSERDPRGAVARLIRSAALRETEAETLRQVAKRVQLRDPEGTGGDLPMERAEVPTSKQATPQGIDAVRRVMREGGVWSPKEMLAELTRRGWEPKQAQHPLPTVEAAINRLFRVKGEIERVGRGEYTYKGFPGTPSLEMFTGRAEP